MPDTQDFKNILCIRADNMGDVIMSSPSFRALKESFNCRITLLTSHAGAIITSHLDCIDAVMTSDLPWLKNTAESAAELNLLVQNIAEYQFDAAIIFTVYSQSALPSAMLAYMAGIPVRAAYSRENPYQLLTTWLPDREPYEHILHQVERDLALVNAVGASTSDDHLMLRIQDNDKVSYNKKRNGYQIGGSEPYLILHPGVSEEKRQYPTENWIEAGKMMIEQYGLPLLISGSDSEKTLAEEIASGIGEGATSVAGVFSIGEFICLVQNAGCVVSVNTSTIHIAAAVQTPVVVLYAQTNPQHTPWKSPHCLLQYSVPAHLKSRNTIIQYVSEHLYKIPVAYPEPEDIVNAVQSLTNFDEVISKPVGRH
jgi:lipopolysaccharide heptosyltransferase II